MAAFVNLRRARQALMGLCLHFVLAEDAGTLTVCLVSRLRSVVLQNRPGRVGP
jgi:hypothetical protein